MTKFQRRWLGVAVVAAVLIVVVWRLSQSPDWREFSWERVWSLVIHASAGWLAAAVVVTYSSYVIRAFRWKFFLDPIKRGSFPVLFAGQVLGFSAVYLVGRPGELVRPAYIARREHVPFASQLAILLLERIYDSVAVALVFALALYLQAVHPVGDTAAATLRRMHQGALLVLLVTAGLVVALIVFRFRAEAFFAIGGRALGFLPPKVRSAIGRIARSVAEGLDVIRSWRDLAASIVCTALLWIANISVFWFVFQSLGGEAASLTWWAAAVAVFCAALGLVAQLPGVGGGFQVGVLAALQQIFHLGGAAAAGVALLLWLVIMVPCVALGLVLLIYGGLSFRKLEAMAEAESEANQTGRAVRERA
jgi:glycosyltransferase 2 family protein